jgi:hypothetical protein
VLTAQVKTGPGRSVRTWHSMFMYRPLDVAHHMYSAENFACDETNTNVQQTANPDEGSSGSPDKTLLTYCNSTQSMPSTTRHREHHGHHG